MKCIYKLKDSEETLVNKYSAWTDIINRGGLKVSSDDMFLLVRESEHCCRKHVDDEKLSRLSYKKPC